MDVREIIASFVNEGTSRAMRVEDKTHLCKDGDKVYLDLADTIDRVCLVFTPSEFFSFASQVESIARGYKLSADGKRVETVEPPSSPQQLRSAWQSSQEQIG